MSHVHIFMFNTLYPFSLTEGVVSYSIPQGMVRGASLELMDHTFDGIEDSQTGDLRGGLGQLVDGKFGWDNFKATSPGGQIKGIHVFLSVCLSVFLNVLLCLSTSPIAVCHIVHLI